jgi:hypothetical protein
MRLFQNSAIYPNYRKRLASLRRGLTSFEELTRAFLDDRFGATHFLKPILDGDPTAFFTNADDELAQQAWARAQGMPANTSAEAILLAQIEAHRTEVFYNHDPIRYGSAFIAKLPGSVRKKIAWRAAPSAHYDFSRYDFVVCNFESILQQYRDAGLKAAYFSPAHDPVFDQYAANKDRPIDVLFVGGYSRHHLRRAAVLEAVAALGTRYNVVFALDRSRMTALAESPIGLFPPLRRLRRPSVIRSVSRDAAFGRDLYALLSKAKIVLNGAVDMAGQDRGNQRCWEALGTAALMVSDSGVYPAGMENLRTIICYESITDAAAQLIKYLENKDEAREIARSGYEMIRARYSKTAQWQRFLELTG